MFNSVLHQHHHETQKHHNITLHNEWLTFKDTRIQEKLRGASGWHGAAGVPPGRLPPRPQCRHHSPLAHTCRAPHRLLFMYAKIVLHTHMYIA